MEKISDIIYENNITCNEINSYNADDVFKKLFSHRMNSFIFRGISSTESVLPGILRNQLDENIDVGKIRDAEIGSLIDYNKLSVQQLPYYQNPIDFLASAQHFGLRTRLIDWTDDPFVALYFATNQLKTSDDVGYVMMKESKVLSSLDKITSNPAKDADNIVLNYGSLIKNLHVFLNNIDRAEEHYLYDILNLYSLDSSERENFILNYLDKNKFFIRTNTYANPRISLQKGLFQVFNFRRYFDPNNPQNININEVVIELLKDSTLYKIDFYAKETILKNLEKLGINQHTLFNDLDNICRYINAKHKL